ncbi:E3 ubiquitin-protein ligase Zswim2-like isoform X2 [Periplaneta americana]|uniref:E3 ubiquitin-protein ligase Zswim2-like isoform X2 n=1 Tax=Periplaneta americana TaxID=6978 RepID=UPI0037E7CA97
MARKSGWRQVCPDPVRNRQLLALFGSSRLFLVRQNGPAAFALQEEGRKKPLVVRLGDPHSCSCRPYRQEHELCLHICWTLLRKLRLKPEDPLSFQRGLVPHELNDLVQGTYVYHSRVKKKNSKPTDTVQPKPISNQDLCPICLEEMMKARRPVTFCRHGCGRAVHIACMKVVAHYQLELDQHDARDDVTLTCPLCRGDFCTWLELRDECRNAPHLRKQRPILPPLVGPRPLHEGVTCTSCNSSPVVGALYRCLTCPYVLMCDVCVTERQGPSVMGLHVDHGLAVKQRPLDRWRPLPGWEPPRRRPTPPQQSSTLSQELIAELPVLRVSKGQALLSRGQQCCLCLQPYQIKQEVQTLPCGHQFHAICVSRWLLHSSDSCPLDDSPVAPALRRRALLRGCELAPLQTGGVRQYKKQKKKLPLQAPVHPQEVGEALHVKGLSLFDRSFSPTEGQGCFRDYERQQRQQERHHHHHRRVKPIMSVEASPRQYASSLSDCCVVRLPRACRQHAEHHIAQPTTRAEHDAPRQEEAVAAAGGPRCGVAVLGGGVPASQLVGAGIPTAYLLPTAAGRPLLS